MFLRDIYPGAKRSPVEWIRMMATPEINPDVKMAGRLTYYSLLNKDLTDFNRISYYYERFCKDFVMYFSFSTYKLSQSKVQG